MKKVTSILLLLFLFITTGYSQVSDPVYLLPDFKDGEIIFHDKSVANIKMNIDIANNRVLYYQGTVLMEVANIYYVDTIKVANKTFVIRENTPCEVVNRKGYTLLIAWHVKAVNIGQKGALGHTTQATVMNVHVRDMYANAGKDDFNPNATAVWREVKDNTYYLCFKGKEYKIKTLKDIYKQFPDKKVDLKKFVKDNHLDIQKAEDALQIFYFLIK